MADVEGGPTLQQLKARTDDLELLVEKLVTEMRRLRKAFIDLQHSVGDGDTDEDTAGRQGRDKSR